MEFSLKYFFNPKYITPPKSPPEIKMLFHSKPSATEFDTGMDKRLSKAASAASLTPIPPKLIGNKANNLANGQIKNHITIGISISQIIAKYIVKRIKQD